MNRVEKILRYRPPSPGLIMLAGVLLVYLVVSRHVISAGIVQGDSMLPTLAPGARYFINHYIYHLREPRHGDVVVFTHPLYADLTVKRVIGVPGDTVELRGARLFLNGAPLDESYVAPHRDAVLPATNRLWRIPAQRYFLMGDNRAVSADSRIFGPVSRRDIKGLVIWP